MSDNCTTSSLRPRTDYSLSTTSTRSPLIYSRQESSMCKMRKVKSAPEICHQDPCSVVCNSAEFKEGIFASLKKLENREDSEPGAKKELRANPLYLSDLDQEMSETNSSLEKMCAYCLIDRREFNDTQMPITDSNFSEFLSKLYCESERVEEVIRTPWEAETQERFKDGDILQKFFEYRYKSLLCILEKMQNQAREILMQNQALKLADTAYDFFPKNDVSDVSQYDESLFIKEEFLRILKLNIPALLIAFQDLEKAVFFCKNFAITLDSLSRHSSMLQENLKQLSDTERFSINIMNRAIAQFNILSSNEKKGQNFGPYQHIDKIDSTYPKMLKYLREVSHTVEDKIHTYLAEKGVFPGICFKSKKPQPPLFNVGVLALKNNVTIGSTLFFPECTFYFVEKNIGYRKEADINPQQLALFIKSLALLDENKLLIENFSESLTRSYLSVFDRLSSKISVDLEQLKLNIRSFEKDLVLPINILYFATAYYGDALISLENKVEEWLRKKIPFKRWTLEEEKKFSTEEAQMKDPYSLEEISTLMQYGHDKILNLECGHLVGAQGFQQNTIDSLLAMPIFHYQLSFLDPRKVSYTIGNLLEILKDLPDGNFSTEDWEKIYKQISFDQFQQIKQLLFSCLQNSKITQSKAFEYASALKQIFTAIINSYSLSASHPELKKEELLLKANRTREFFSANESLYHRKAIETMSALDTFQMKILPECIEVCVQSLREDIITLSLDMMYQNGDVCCPNCRHPFKEKTSSNGLSEGV